MSEKANIHLLTFNVIVPLSINLKPQVFEKNYLLVSRTKKSSQINFLEKNQLENYIPFLSL